MLSHSREIKQASEHIREYLLSVAASFLFVSIGLTQNSIAGWGGGCFAGIPCPAYSSGNTCYGSSVCINYAVIVGSCLFNVEDSNRPSCISSSSCVGNTYYLKIPTCTDSGWVCQASTPIFCGAYACDPSKKCLSSCSSPSDCASSDYVCVNGKCVIPTTSTVTSTQTTTPATVTSTVTTTITPLAVTVTTTITGTSPTTQTCQWGILCRLIVAQ